MHSDSAPSSARRSNVVLAKAMDRTAYVSAHEQLVNKARLALAKHGTNFGEAKAEFAASIRDEAALLWEIFASERDAVLSAFIRTVHNAGRTETVGRKPSQTSGVGHLNTGQKVFAEPASPPRLPFRAAGAPRQPGQPRNPDLRMQPSKLDAWKPAVVDAMEDERRRSKLYTFLVNGKPLAEVTAAEARGWAKSHERDSRFVRLMVDQVPDAMLVGDCRTAEEAEKLYRQAEENGHGE